MKIWKWITLVVMVMMLAGCATPGPQFIDIRYLGDAEPQMDKPIGLAAFFDRRKDVEPGYVGYRELMGDDRQTYYVFGKDLSKTLTHITESYLNKKGWAVAIMDPWEPSFEGIKKAEPGKKQILTAAINRFECRAKKTGVATKMTLDISMSFYLGQIDDRVRLKTIPITLSLERTELGFTPEKLEGFVSQSMTEVLEKALVF